MENQTAPADAASYTVVARRYRPRSFAELIGQDHIAQALGTAIDTGRVGHAYLFTGARGVGKTSTARIFAKVLNTPEGTPPELVSDISQAIDSGEDMDVIEIDGASNRGIEEIRQLRANVNVRPSRARYKVYIIDEVHMLTNQAFNALLKTLEEPPAHVKFIFCTTDPDKIPITVLSRCQRFDFAPVKLDAIQKRLQEICTNEGYTADEEALALLARRAAGSMRDSQSLLEQVMSFSSENITVELVHQLLGIADEGRLLAIAEAVAHNQPLQALQLLEEATRGGADPGQLAEQLLNYFRDLMAVGIGGGPELMKLANPAGHAKVKEVADAWGVQSILSAIQILDESLVRMRTSVSAEALLEVALVQICQLTSLASIPALLEALAAGNTGTAVGRPPAGSEKKNASPPAAVSSPAAAASTRVPINQPDANQPAATPGNATPGNAAPLSQPAAGASAANTPPASQAQPAGPSADATAWSATPSPTGSTGPAPAPAATPRPSNPTATAGTPSVAGPSGSSQTALEQWRSAVGTIDGMLADFASLAVAVVPNGSEQWDIIFPPGAVRPREYCDQAERKAELVETVQRALGRSLRLVFSVMPGEAPKAKPTTPTSTTRVQKMREVSEDPFVKKLCDVLDGEIIRIDSPPPQYERPPRPPEPKAKVSP